MPDEPSAEDVRLARQLYAEWNHGRGASKSAIERREWNDASSHGRRFDRVIRQTLGLPTHRPSKQSDRIAELERQIRMAGQHPVGRQPDEWQVQLQHSRRAALSAVRAWNDPAESFRTGTFALLLVTAWNSLAIALLQRRGDEWREVDSSGSPQLKEGAPKAKDTRELIDLAWSEPTHAGLRENLRWWIDLRNVVAHRCLPALDIPAIPKAQATLLNFENALARDFGDDYVLGVTMSVPLQLTGFRDPGFLGSLKQLQASLPLDVQAFLTRSDDVAAELLADPTYSLRVAFVPVVANSGRNPDVVAHFVRPEDAASLPDDVIAAIVMTKLATPPRPQLNAKRVVAQVSQAIPFRFNASHHTEVSRRLKVRPPSGSDDQSKTDLKFCEYVQAVKTHLYNDAWVARLIEVLATEDGFREATGRPPVLRDDGCDQTVKAE